LPVGVRPADPQNNFVCGIICFARGIINDPISERFENQTNNSEDWIMRRRGFPRYAPESLERKLSPSGVAVPPVAAVVYVSTTQTPASDSSGATDTDSTSTSDSDPGPPGGPDPTDPTNPGPDDGDGNPPIPPTIPDGPDGLSS
jgi:hypothetical protein